MNDNINIKSITKNELHYELSNIKNNTILILRNEIPNNMYTDLGTFVSFNQDIISNIIFKEEIISLPINFNINSIVSSTCFINFDSNSEFYNYNGVYNVNKIPFSSGVEQYLFISNYSFNIEKNILKYIESCDIIYLSNDLRKKLSLLEYEFDLFDLTLEQIINLLTKQYTKAGR